MLPKPPAGSSLDPQDPRFLQHGKDHDDDSDDGSWASDSDADDGTADEPATKSRGAAHNELFQDLAAAAAGAEDEEDDTVTHTQSTPNPLLHT